VKELTVEVINNEIWLKCQQHGLVKFFGVYAALGDLIATENEHATIHLHAVLDAT
jgi:hypothetical protein